jgi:glycosyltransferase involved in cell wall biosynthesis
MNALTPAPARIVCLSNVIEQGYHDLRGEKIAPSLSWGKRRDLFRCLEIASGKELIVLSCPPKALERRSPRWLSEVETRFGTHRQWFCPNWDVPKLRVPLAWFFYARQVLRHARSGDLVVLDNYELLYVIAAWLLRLFRRVTFLLDYEDGKHVIDRGLARLLSATAESAGRPLMRGALLAHPALGQRLPETTPKLLMPGFIVARPSRRTAQPDSAVRFLYSGSLDEARGVDLLLAALPHLPEQGWRLDITGTGPLAAEVARVAGEAKWGGRVVFHQTLPTDAYNRLVDSCQVGLNCQRSSDPISGVTFPSKMFGYLSAGLLVISSRASGVEHICGKACLYFDPQTPQGLAHRMTEVVQDFAAAQRRSDPSDISRWYSLEGTAPRLRQFLAEIGFLARNAEERPAG